MSAFGLNDLGDIKTHDEVCGQPVAAESCQLRPEHSGPCVPKLRGAFIPMPVEPFARITPGLYQGGAYFRPLRRDFTAVLDHYRDAVAPEDGLEHHRVLFDDDGVPAPELLFESMQWVFNRWNDGGNVLVRCQAGLNRSGLTCALVLIRAGLTPAEAIDTVRQGRSPYALCNPRFVDYLRSLDV